MPDQFGFYFEDIQVILSRLADQESKENEGKGGANLNIYGLHIHPEPYQDNATETEKPGCVMYDGLIVNDLCSYYAAFGVWPSDTKKLHAFRSWHAYQYVYADLTVDDDKKREVITAIREGDDCFFQENDRQIREVMNLQEGIDILYLLDFPEIFSDSSKWEEWNWWFRQARKVIRLFKNLKELRVQDNPYGYYSDNGILCQTVKTKEKDSTVVVLCPAAYPQSNIFLNSSVREIGEHAFDGVNTIREVVIEGSVILRESCFRNARNLRKVTIKGEKASLLSGAFQDCPSLTDLEVPIKSVINCCEAFDRWGIAYQMLLAAWIDASGYQGDPERIGLFGRAGEDVWIYYDEKEKTDHIIGHGRSWDYEEEDAYEWEPMLHGDGDLIIHHGVTAIGESLCSDGSFRTIIIEDGVKDIGAYAFYDGGCETMMIPPSVEHIGGYLFATDPCHVNTVIVPAGVKTIDPMAFYWRADDPNIIIFTGDKPPKDWIMWHQSALFDCNLSDEAWGDVYYPESWRNVLNEEYFQNLRETMIRTPVPEDNDYYDSLDLQMDFIEHLQAAVLGKKADDGEEEEPASWIPYSTFADIPDVEIASAASQRHFE